MVMPLLISRRRGVRRPGRDRGVLRPLRPARPPHRRLGAFHHQQPDRLHHLSALLALVALSVRRRQDDRGADLPRQRRRSRGGGLRRQGRDRVPAEVPGAGRHRHVLLPPLRPQRGRRAGLHPAADVQGDPLASDDARDLRQAAGRRGRRHRRRSREDEGRLARAARRRAGGEPGLQGQQGRLARRPLGRHEARRRRRRSAPRQHRRRGRDAAGHRPQAHRGAAGLPRPPHDPALPRRARARRSRPARASTGRPPRRWRSARCCSKAIRCGSPARTASAARSRSATRC